MNIETPLLTPDEPPSFVTRPAESFEHVIVVCDHAGNLIPKSMDNLGVRANLLNEHIAIDRGALGVAQLLAERLGAMLIHGVYSRLVADLNRAPHDSGVIPVISDGVLISGNLALERSDREARLGAIHTPYHAEIHQQIEKRLALGIHPVLIAIHSFTPQISHVIRPWHAGVLWDRDVRLAIPLLEHLRLDPSLIVGDNEPYSGRHTADYTLDRHGEGNGLAHAAIEIRQDLIESEREQDSWAERLYDALAPVLKLEYLHMLAQVTGRGVA